MKREKALSHLSFVPYQDRQSYAGLEPQLLFPVVVYSIRGRGFDLRLSFLDYGTGHCFRQATPKTFIAGFSISNGCIICGISCGLQESGLKRLLAISALFDML